MYETLLDVINDNLGYKATIFKDRKILYSGRLSEYTKHLKPIKENLDARVKSFLLFSEDEEVGEIYL